MSLNFTFYFLSTNEMKIILSPWYLFFQQSKSKKKCLANKTFGKYNFRRISMRRPLTHHIHEHAHVNHCFALLRIQVSCLWTIFLSSSLPFSFLLFSTLLFSSLLFSFFSSFLYSSTLPSSSLTFSTLFFTHLFSFSVLPCSALVFDAKRKDFSILIGIMFFIT